MEEPRTGFALMAETAPIFARMAQTAGLRPKGAYSVKEVARASGLAYATLCDDAAMGIMRSKLTPGRVRGRMVEPEWFDEYWTKECHG